MKVVIVGGVAGGATAAARLRRLDEKAEIVIFEKTGYVSYANCGLPYYIGGIIEDSNELTLQTPESFFHRFRIDVKTRHEVIKIFPESKTVIVKDLENDITFEESYDKLILSPGAKPIKPHLFGIDNQKIYSLRTVEDTLRIREYIEKSKPKTAVVIGGGFIGLEVAENLCEMGVDVTLVQKSDQVMNPLDYDMATLVHAKLRESGIHLRLNGNVIGFEERTQGLHVLLENDESLQADIVLLAIGVSPDTSIAKEAGLKLGIRDAIVVNEKMQTSHEDIYAVGDAIQVQHGVTHSDTLIALAGPANKQGRVAADNICGLESCYKGSWGSSVIKLFDMTIAMTGINEKTAQMSNIDYERIVLSPSSHAGYYPDAKVMTMKVIFEKNTLRLLGAQIIGYDGVDKRIDVFSTAMQAGLKASDLKHLDLAYAPPYSSAKDPINIAGFMIENIVNRKMKQFHWNEIDELIEKENVTLLDTRTIQEYEKGHIDGFINIPVDELRNRYQELDSSHKIYVLCQSGLRSYIACRILMQEGFDCYNFSGGYRFYEVVLKDKIIAKKSYPCGMDR